MVGMMFKIYISSEEFAVLKNINLRLVPRLFLYCCSVCIFFSVKYHKCKFTPEHLRARPLVDLPADATLRFIMSPL